MAAEILRFQCFAIMARERKGGQWPGLFPEHGCRLKFCHLACFPPVDACNPGENEDRQENKDALQGIFPKNEAPSLSGRFCQSICQTSPALKFRRGAAYPRTSW